MTESRNHKLPANKKSNEVIKQDQIQKTDGFPIVGIGASAGGLAAFEAFFSGIQGNQTPNMAFILVQHLAPDHKSILNEIIGRYTQMKVIEVEDGMVVQPNCVYIIPPNSDMSLLGGALMLFEPSSARGMRMPIDFFFRSLALELKEEAICIILSGTGSDGTKGLKEIKEAGGLVLVQSLDTAEYDGMPRSAIETGLADYELAPREMAGQIISVIEKEKRIRNKVEVAFSLNEESAVLKIFSLIRAQSGHDFSKYKPNMIHRRIERRLVVNKIDTMTEYIKYLQRNPVEVEILFRDFLIGVTNFFRDPEIFDIIEEKVIPTIFSDKMKGSKIRIWVPGCSTGEEAYSIAILVKEYIEKTNMDFTVQIFASDIDSQAIETARLGQYSPQIAENITPERLERCFTFDSENKHYRINKSIRDMLIFSEQSIIKDPPFSKLDLISCRNLLIYLNGALQEKLLAIFSYALNPKGILILGTSESVGDYNGVFLAIDRKSKIFQWKEELLLAKQKLPLLINDPYENIKIQDAPRTPGKITAVVKQPLREITEKALLQELEPVAVLVCENGDILYYYGHTGMYLEPTPGEAGIANILKMVREGLVAELTLALNKARNNKEIIHVPRIKVKKNGYYALVKLTIKPIMTNVAEPTDKPLYLVIFEDIPNSETDHEDDTKSIEGTIPENENRIELLKREIKVKEEYLKNANEELETSNEELKSANEEMQSINEELQSTNEELETSKEELQSVNEELATVNAELQNKVSDLSQANNDMNNLLAGTNIATVFVNHQLRITRFTPTATEIINLISGDIGRPLTHVVSNLVDYQNMSQDIQYVLDTLIPREMQVQALDGKWYVMRIQPYRTIQNVIEGAVITFVDISSIKFAEDALAFSKACYQRLFETAKEGLLILDPDTGKITDANPYVIELLGFTQEQLINKSIWDIGQFKDIAANRQKFLDLQSQAYVQYKDMPLITLDGRKIEVEFTSSLYSVGLHKVIHCHIRLIRSAESTPID